MGRRRAQTEIAESVPGMGFQAVRRALTSHSRAEAIDDAQVCQKPLFRLVRASLDLFQFRIKIGMGGNGKICQWKRKPVTRGLQEGFFTRPAGKEARHAEMIRQRLKAGAFAKREESLSERGGIDVAANFFDIDAQPMLTANCDQRHVCRVGYVELQRAGILLGCKPGLAAGKILETDLRGGNCKVAGQQGSKCRTTSGKVNSVSLEVKSVGSRDLIGGQNDDLGARSRRLVETHAPDVNTSGRNPDVSHLH